MVSLEAANRDILALFKTTHDGGQRGLLLLNKDLRQSQSHGLPEVEHLLGGTVSLAWPDAANATTLLPAGFQVFASSDAW
jgi:hypothetical protein